MGAYYQLINYYYHLLRQGFDYKYPQIVLQLFLYPLFFVAPFELQSYSTQAILFLSGVSSVSEKMKPCYCLQMDPALSLEDAWQKLEDAGAQILYASQEDGFTELYVETESPEVITALDGVHSCLLKTLPSINWEEQWAAHGRNFRDGFVHLDLSELKASAPELILQPGPGFGDLSHPTTRLVLKMMARYLDRQPVIDIGCGSGILTIAAAALGSLQAYGIDIDLDAIRHSRKNAQLNHLEGRCHFYLTEEFTWNISPDDVLICMNMIQTEQVAAWNSLNCLHAQTGFCVTSGIRRDDKDDHLVWMERNGWNLIDEEDEEGWCAFCHQK